MTPYTQVDFFEVTGEVFGEVEYFDAVRKLMTLLTYVDRFDMKGELTGLAETLPQSGHLWFFSPRWTVLI